MRKFTILAIALVMAGCASTSGVQTPQTRTDKLTAQQNLEKVYYQNIYQDNMTVNDNQVVLIGRNKQMISKQSDYTENELIIIKRSKTAKLATAQTLLTVASIFALTPITPNSFQKDQLRGEVLEPKFDNKTLDYARPLLQNWINTQAIHFAPNDKPITKVVIEPKRFYLVYENLVGKEAYRLTNSLDIVLYNTELTSEAYRFECEKNSHVETLAQWQANHYAKVNQILNAQIDSCMADLMRHKDKVYAYLAKNLQS